MAETSLQAKLKQIERGRDKANTALSNNKATAIVRQLDNLKEIITEVTKLQRDVEAKKIEAGKTSEEIDEWANGIEHEIEKADECIELLEEWLEKEKLEKLSREQEERIQYEVKLHETKLKLQEEFSSDAQPGANGNDKPKVQAKLPKLVITKFNGTYADWMRFWGEFSETIDKTNVASVTKFTYLRELLCDKARNAIEALPHTAEGYNRAIAILTDKFGKRSEIVKSYVKAILDLPHVPTANIRKIHDFYDKLAYNVQSLETMKSLSAVDGTVSMTLDKLPAIRGDLVRDDKDWENWNFLKLTEALKFWTRRNPVETCPREEERRPKGPSSRVYTTQQRKGQQLTKPKECVYCHQSSHKSQDCEVVTSPSARKKILAANKLCFNCTGSFHHASKCKSPVTCQHCPGNARHHSSICDKSTSKETKPERVMTAHTSEDQNMQVIYPILLVEIDGIKTHALLDTGSGSSYASEKLIDLLKRRPKETKTKQIDMMLGSTTQRVEIYSATLGSSDDKYHMNIDLTKVNKPQLLKVDNPNYEKVLSSYQHLKGVKIDYVDQRSQIPVHVVLGASEYAAIKTVTPQRVGKPGQPVAEKTLLGWTVMSPGREDLSPVLLTQSSQADYHQLCAMDVLGLADTHENDQQVVYDEFKEQLERHPTGWYATKLPWRANHPPLATNEMGSKRRLEQLIRKLQRDGQYEQYDNIIQQQIKDKIVEPAPEKATGKEYYIPHKAVTRVNAESTKLRIVYDASSKENNQASLNDCLHPGPPLQNRLWDILVRSRFYPCLLTGDLKQAFLQVRIKEEERDSLRFHWRSPNSDHTEVLRFTRALFGTTSSPFLLGEVINQHLDAWESKHPEVVKQLRDGTYVDDLMLGSETIESTKAKKTTAIEIFDDATFTIHKWHSNVPELEADSKPANEQEELTYAKQQLGAGEPSAGKLLGLQWERKEDTLGVSLKSKQREPTKRGILSQLASVYDPLGLASPVTLIAKQLYRDICDSKVPWDAKIPDPLLKRWNEWNRTLRESFTVPRALTPHQQPITQITLHGFGDTSSTGISCAVYAVVHQEQGITQQLVCAKSRLAKRDLTIPRLELIAGHMAVNLVTNVQAAIGTYPSATHCWLDSTVALYWIKGRGEYRQFVANRVHKIQQYEQVTWHHVPTNENPADLGSRGGEIENSTLWRQGPSWLSDSSKWPPDVTLQATEEVLAETKATREVLGMIITQLPVLDQEFKYPLTKSLRIAAWVIRFIHNTREKTNKRRSAGPLNTEDIEKAKTWCIRLAQRAEQVSSNFQTDKIQLNLQPNKEGLLECRGRIVGEYPIYLPDTHPFTAKMVELAHLVTKHGGVGLTMAKVREKYWVPRLRSLVKKVRNSCYGCKRFRVKSWQAPPPGNLPESRTKGTVPFQVVGIDFTGAIRYQSKSRKPKTDKPKSKKQEAESKAYVALYACSLTRAVYLDLLKSLETQEFIQSLKRFIARRGRPEIIYSDNGSNLKGAEKWLEQVQSDERVHQVLIERSIVWKFNLTRAPWWGGQFERLIGLFKRAFYKAIGNGTLTWSELEELVLDVEVALNNRPLSYLEDDVQLPVLTPISMLNVNSNIMPEQEAHHIPEKDLRRRARYLRSCKEAVWKRWSREYIRGLREQHRNVAGDQTSHPKEGEVVIIYEETQNRNIWKMGIVSNLIRGRDGVVRGAKVRTGKGVLERPIQHLYPLELSCDRYLPRPTDLNPDAAEFNPRPQRLAAVAAKDRIHAVACAEQE